MVQGNGNEFQGKTYKEKSNQAFKSVLLWMPGYGLKKIVHPSFIHFVSTLGFDF